MMAKRVVVPSAAGMPDEAVEVEEALNHGEAGLFAAGKEEGRVDAQRAGRRKAGAPVLAAPVHAQRRQEGKDALGKIAL